MSLCNIQESGAIELYFYAELTHAEHARIDLHLRGCRECAAALAELQLIREALAARPEVAARPTGDWSAFMQRLDAAIAPPAGVVLPFPARTRTLVRRPLVGWLVMAALLALVTLSAFVASRAGRSVLQPEAPREPASVVSADAAGDVIPVASGLRTVGLRHLERSKLVVLGLAAKDAAPGPGADWAYERELASALLADTKLYRMAAEERGLQALAGVMRDLEIVLLQASMAQEADASALPQIQRLIRKRSLVEKMDVVGTTGLLP